MAQGDLACWIGELASDHVFTLEDAHQTFPDLSRGAISSVLSRLARKPPPLVVRVGSGTYKRTDSPAKAASNGQGRHTCPKCSRPTTGRLCCWCYADQQAKTLTGSRWGVISDAASIGT